MAMRIDIARTDAIQTRGNSHIPDKESASKEKAWRACQEFESILLYQLLSTMRRASMNDEDESQFGFGNEIFKSMIDEQLSLAIARSGGIGISKMIAKDLGIDFPGKTPAQSLHRDAGAGKAVKGDIQAKPIKTVPEPKKIISQSKPKEGRLISQALGNLEEKIKPYEGIIRKAADLFGVSFNLIKAVIIQESSGNPNAISPRGAKGLMQLTDRTARELGVTDPFDPVQNIFAGTRLLARLVKKFNGDLNLALASYNAGVAAVEKHNGIPPYKETREYVRRVTTYLSELGGSG